MKGSGENGGEVDVGLKLQNQDPSFQSQSHQNDYGSNGGDDAVYNGGGDSGPTCNVFTTTITSRHPYHVSPSHPFFKPLGGISREEMMGYPFTESQRKELERQAMIYKYMVSSLPVPPHLLYPCFPTTATFSPFSYFLGRYGNGLNYRWLGNSKDAEPMRCRRTDGKKWRCSRDVAPNQKYCERHMHRGKPRSRKPVELVFHPHNSLSEFPISKDINISPTKKTRMNEPNPQALEYSFPGVLASKVSTFDHPVVCGNMPFDDSRSFVGSDEQQWQQLVQTSMTNQVFQHQLQEESLNLNTQVGFDAKTETNLFQRPLIDAWPMLGTGNKDNSGINNVSFTSSNDGRGNTIDKDMYQIHMGLQLLDPWANSSASPGGPLAEVLRPGSVHGSTNRSALNLITSDVGEADFNTISATTVSSPSGVLHKTLASLSDSSGCSSPTCLSSRANSDVPFHWLN